MVFTHAESEWVQLLTDTGILGLALALGVAAALALSLGAGMAAPQDDEKLPAPRVVADPKPADSPTKAKEAKKDARASTRPQPGRAAIAAAA